jgi:hypothetical protein
MQQAIRRQQPLAVMNPDSFAARDIDALAGHLLIDRDSVGHSDVGDFLQRYLSAAASMSVTAPVGRSEPPASVPRRGDLEAQITHLSGRIDELIEEIERLRARGAGTPSPYPVGGAGRTAVSGAWIASLATDSEQVSVHADRFPVYHFVQSDGRLLPFAFHSRNDALHNDESKTTSS